MINSYYYMHMVLQVKQKLVWNWLDLAKTANPNHSCLVLDSDTTEC